MSEELIQPKTYEYWQDGEYDSPYFFGDEDAEEGTVWCKACDTMGLYQLAKESITTKDARIEELSQRIYELEGDAWENKSLVERNALIKDACK